MATPAEIGAFVEKVVAAMGLTLKAEAEEMPDGLRINLTGEDGSLLIRRQGEALAALQHVVAAVFRQDVDERRRLVVDCLGYRKGKDAELKQMATFLAAEGARHRPRAGDWPAQSVRAAHRPPGRGRGRVGVVGEHRRRVREDGHHFGEVRTARQRAALQCFPSTTRSWPSRPRSVVRRSASSGSRAPMPCRSRGASPAIDARSSRDTRPRRHRSRARRSHRPGQPDVERANGLARACSSTSTLASATTARGQRSGRRHVLSAPHSYTGEDVAEISAHGSPVVLRGILGAAMAAGARLAEPGEFTLRAFLNGKLDLVQAEAVAD